MPQTKRSSSSTRRRTSTNRKKNQKNRKYDSPIIDEVIFLISITVTVLLFLCNFHIIGSVGDKISIFMFGLFGYLAYLAPLLIFFGVYFMISNVGNHIAKVKLIAGIVLSIMICIIFTFISGIEEIGTTFSSFYKFSANNLCGGGILGGGISYLLTQLLGKIGTVLIAFVCIIICGVLLTEKSLLNFMKKSSNTLRENAKADYNRRYELAREREANRENIKEEKHQRRMDKKVFGVTNLTTLNKLPVEEPKEPKKIKDTNEEIIKSDSPMNALENIKIKGIDENISIPSNRVLGKEIGQGEEIIHSIEHDFKSNEHTSNIDPLKHSEESKIENSNLGDISVDDQAKPIKICIPYKFPPINLLSKGTKKSNADNGKSLRETALRLQQTLQNFGVNVTVTDISQGPAVTRYELQPEIGVKVSKIVNLADDIKLNLAATDIRIEAPIPGKAAVGIEVPNSENTAVAFRDLIETNDFTCFKSKLAFAVGKDIGGQTVIADISKMPHMLIAGATGSGKSVCINTIIMSLLYKASPDEVKLIMIDPKVVELSIYNGIPHLMVPVVTEPPKAAAALHWAVAEMTERYKKFADLNVRDLAGYNKKVETMADNVGKELPTKMPQIVIIVDELADLMMVSPGEVEECICRLAQLARACGIHLIIATQRPSVDVITGLIKANMPSRIAFSVSSGVDSRTILDMNGAEKLLGKGDMLFYPNGVSKPSRVQGAFVSDSEVSSVVDFIKEQFQGHEYENEIEQKITTFKSADTPFKTDHSQRDSYFIEAGQLIIDKEKASIGMLQRIFKIGFNRAARIMDQLEEIGVVGPEEGTKPRRVLMSAEQFAEIVEKTQD